MSIVRTLFTSRRARRRGTQGTRKQLDADLLTRREVEALLAQCPAHSWVGLRNRTLIIVLWRTGLRISEALALGEKDLDLAGGRLVVQRGKGGKRRVVGIDAPTIRSLEQWLGRRIDILPADGTPLFCTRHGGGVDASYVRHLLPRLARTAGVQKRVHAHAFRHLFAIELEAEGASLSAIRDLLGHSSLATTDAYLRRLGAAEAVEFARRREWDH